MSLAIKYESVEDASLRLKNTIVMYKGEPVYIKQLVPGDGKDDIIRVLFQALPLNGEPEGARFIHPRDLEKEENDNKRKYISSKHFDIAPFKLGYVNRKKGLFYCTRNPNRIQKQGLCGDNFLGEEFISNRPVLFGDFLRCPETVECIKGIYPTFDRALALLKEIPAVAFHRDFCITRDEVIPHLIYLYHKNKKIGYFNKDEVIVGTKFACLKETLNEMHIKVGVC